MKLARPVRLALCCVALSYCSAFAQQAAPVRLAILTGDGDRAVADATLAQLEVALTENKEVTLLERAQIRKILAEQKLSAAGLSDPATAVKLGRLLSVEMFLFLDRVPNSNPPASRLQIVESRTGFSLVAGVIEEKATGADVGTVNSLLRLAVIKRNVPLEDRHAVSVLGVRNEEPGHALDPLAQAVEMLLAADLNEVPGLILLDRDHLDRLRKEETLTGLSAELLRSATLLEVGVHRATEKGQLEATIRLLPMAGGEPRRYSRALPLGDLAAIRSGILSIVLSALNAKERPFQAEDPLREAAAFNRECRTRVCAGDFDGAVRAGEASFALDPNDINRVQLATACAFAAQSVWGYRMGGYERLADSGKRRALLAAIRQKSLVRDQYKLNLTEGKGCPSSGDGWYGVPGMCFRSAGGDIGELQRELQGIEEEIYQMRRAQCAQRVEQTGEFWQWYRFWGEMNGWLRLGQPGLSSDQIRWLRRAFESIAQPVYSTQSAIEDKLIWPWDLAQGLLKYADDASLKEDRAAFVRFFREFCDHPDPKLRMAAYASLFALGEDRQASGNALVETFLTHFPDNHPARSACADQMFFCQLIRPAITLGYKDDAKGMSACCMKIVGPYLDRASVPYVLAWQSLIEEWLNVLGVQKKEAEERALAERVRAVLANDPDKRANHNRDEWLRTLTARYGPPPKNAVADSLEWGGRELAPVRFASPKSPNSIMWESPLTRVRGNRLYYASWEDIKAPPEKIHLRVYALPDGGDPLLDSETTVPPLASFQLSGLPTLRGVTASDKDVYVGTARGIVVFPLNGSKPHMIAEQEGLSTADVTAIEWHDGRLYLALGGGADIGKRALSAFDPGSGSCTLIASTAGTQPRVDVPDFQKLLIVNILSDPQRRCLWLCTTNAGLWRYDPAADRFEQVAAWASPLRDGRWIDWSENNLLVHDYDHVFLVDLDKRSVAWIAGIYEPSRVYVPAGSEGPPRYQWNFVRIQTVALAGSIFVMDDSRNLNLYGEGSAPAVKQQSVISLHWTSFGILAVDGEKSFYIRSKTQAAGGAP